MMGVVQPSSGLYNRKPGHKLSYWWDARTEKEGRTAGAVVRTGRMWASVFNHFIVNNNAPLLVVLKQPPISGL